MKIIGQMTLTYFYFYNIILIVTVSYRSKSYGTNVINKLLSVVLIERRKLHPELKTQIRKKNVLVFHNQIGR